METPIETYKAVIAIAAIRPPKRGKSFTIETEDGNEFSIWPDKIGLLRTGEQYEIDASDKLVGNRIYHDIVGTPRHLGPYRAATQETPKPQPQANGSTKMDYWTPKPRSPLEQKQIWVNALLGREIEKSPVLMSHDELLARAKIHADVWDQIFGNNLMARE